MLNCQTYLKAREAAVYWYWGGNRNEPRVWGFRDDPWAARPRGWRPQPQRGQQHWHEAGGRKLIKMIWLSPGRERGDTRVLQLWHRSHWHTQNTKPLPTVTLQFKQCLLLVEGAYMWFHNSEYLEYCEYWCTSMSKLKNTLGHTEMSLCPWSHGPI